jgi:hypothetical protein
MSETADLVIFAIDLLLTGISMDEAAQRVSNGIAARAQASGRDVTDEEMALVKGLADEAERRRRGGAPAATV